MGHTSHEMCNKNLSQSSQLVSYFCTDRLTVTVRVVNIQTKTITYFWAIVFIYSFKGETSTEKVHISRVCTHS